MRGSSMKSQEPGAPAGKLASSRCSREARRLTLCLPMGLITISKRQTWQIILAVISLFAHAAAVHSNGPSAASYGQFSDASSRMTRSELTTVNNGQEHGSIEPAGRGLLTGTAIPETLSQSSVWPSLSPSAVVPAHVTPHASPTSMSFAANSSNQSSMVESTVLESQSSTAASELPSRNATLPMTSHSPKAEFSADVASNNIIQLALETTTYIPHPSAAGTSVFGRPFATTPLDLDTAAVGTPAEANLTLSYQSSHVKEHVTGSDATSQPLYLGTTKKHEVSSATDNMLSAVLTGGTKMGLKDVSSVVEEPTGPSVASTHDTISKSKSGTTSFVTSFQYWQPSSRLPLSTLRSGDTATGYSAPFLQTGSSEAMTNTESYGRKEETPAAARVTAIFSSELPSTDSGPTPPVEMDASSISAEPEAHLPGKQTVSPRKSSATPSPSPNSTLLATTRVTLMSKGSSETETLTMSSPTNDAIVHTLAARNGSTLSSLPSLDSEGVTLPIGATSAGMVHADMPTAGLTAGTTMELSKVTPPQRKHAISTPAIPTPTHATASLASQTEQGRSSVVPTHRAVSTSFASLGSSWASVPGSTLEMYIKATEGHMAREEQAGPTTTLLSSAEVWRPHPKATTTSPSVASSAFRIAPHLPTRVLEVDLNTSATTALLTNPRILPSESKPTARTVCSCIPCITTSNIATSFIPSQSKSARLPASSRPLWTRKGSVTTLEPTDAKKNTDAAVLHPRGTSPQETNTTLLMGAKSVIVTQNDQGTKQLGLTFKAPVLSRWSTRKEDRILSRPTSSLTMVHILPLWFRLIQIDYTESLEKKSSESYKKLEKEVKLILNKILSTYEAFLQTNIHCFLNGSVMVDSEAVFQARGPVPSSSDVIRTIVTEVEIKKMDTFFDWRVDVQSLWSNGFSLKNLEPEKLAVSFTVLGVGPRSTFGGMISWEHLENLRSQVILLLGTLYAVQNISLAEVGNTHHGIDINGMVYVNTNTHVDIGWALEVLMGLSNYSVDLTSLSINGSKLSLQVFPVSFLVTNRVFDERMMDRSSAEHQHIARDLSETLMHILSKYTSLLQVAIREITGGSLVCHGDAIFHHPAPTSKDVLQTLSLSVGPNDYLDSSSFQVDPFSFTVAGDGLEPPFPNPGFPGYGIAIIVLCTLALIAFPILALLPKILGRKDKIIINRVHDPEAGVETFELDNPGFRTTVEKDDDGRLHSPTEAVA